MMNDQSFGVISAQERSFGLVALLDAHSEATIRSLWRGLELEKITDSLPSIVCAQPHITLGMFSRFTSQLRSQFSGLAASHLPFGVRFSSVGVFPNREGSTVFLTPVVTEKLLALQQDLRLLLQSEDTELHEFYQEGNWQPHSSLGFGLSHSLAAQALEFSLGLDLPIIGQVQAIGLIEMIKQGPYVISGCELERWGPGYWRKAGYPRLSPPETLPVSLLSKTLARPSTLHCLINYALTVYESRVL